MPSFTAPNQSDLPILFYQSLEVGIFAQIEEFDVALSLSLQ